MLLFLFLIILFYEYIFFSTFTLWALCMSIITSSLLFLLHSYVYKQWVSLSCAFSQVLFFLCVCFVLLWYASYFILYLLIVIIPLVSGFFFYWETERVNPGERLWGTEGRETNKDIYMRKKIYFQEKESCVIKKISMERYQRPFWWHSARQVQTTLSQSGSSTPILAGRHPWSGPSDAIHLR